MKDLNDDLFTETWPKYSSVLELIYEAFEQDFPCSDHVEKALQASWDIMTLHPSITFLIWQNIAARTFCKHDNNSDWKEVINKFYHFTMKLLTRKENEQDAHLSNKILDYYKGTML